MKMQTKTAYKLGIKALKVQRRNYAFTRNVGTKMLVETPATRLAIENYDRVTLAMEILQKEMEKI